MSKSKYTLNKDYFKQIDSPDKAYWLGFLYADGSIQSRGNSKLLELSLAEADLHHLEKFLNSIGANNPIRHRVSKYKDKEYPSCRVTICNMEFCNDLINLGCTIRKTYTIQFPTNDIVPKEYMRDFIRGLFDGDGCIAYGNNGTTLFSTFTGMEHMVQELSSYLVSEDIIHKIPLIHHDKRSKACSIYIYGDNNKYFLDYIYKNCDLYLDRKYNKYMDFYKDYQPIDKHGVYWHKENKAYMVTIYINGQHIRVGQFKDLDEAIKARKEAEVMKMKMKNNLPT